MKRLMTAAVVLIAATSLSVAQPSPGSEPMKMPMAGEAGQGMMAGTPKMPEVSAEQLTRIDAQRISHLRQVGPIKTDIAIKEIELSALWRQDNLDARKISAKVTEISALKARLETAKTEHRIAMHNIYTPEQRKAMHSGMGSGMMGGGTTGRGMMGSGMMHGGMMGQGMMGGCPMMRGGMTE